MFYLPVAVSEHHAVFKSLGTLKRHEAYDFHILVNGEYFKDFAGTGCSETATGR
jgi:hypothetical protein